jgi:acyl-homoserine-lactone acylase
LVSANQSPFKVTGTSIDSKEYSGLVYHQDNSRSTRLKQLIAEKKEHSIESMIELMADTSLVFPVIRNIDFSALFELNANDGLDSKSIALLEVLKQWDYRADLKSLGAAVFSLVFHKYKEYYTYSKCPDIVQVATKEELKTCLQWASKHYKKGMTLGDIQFLERGNKLLPVSGIPDSVNSIRPFFENGRFIAEEGGAFQLIIDLKRKEVLACHPYGSSSAPHSPHYNDQMEMYVQNEYRRIAIFD